ncbi:unnamed protein product [Thlaspi arvense]|uniref:Uncharacterized protein n=1 Tax=Thlaspi arvense TaxID=13288 RepID=A0AAU9RZQ2_THLAR|nr:unnamed protein product [Thlaspi arvense]
MGDGRWSYDMKIISDRSLPCQCLCLCPMNQSPISAADSDGKDVPAGDLRSLPCQCLCLCPMNQSPISAADSDGKDVPAGDLSFSSQRSLPCQCLCLCPMNQSPISAADSGGKGVPAVWRARGTSEMVRPEFDSRFELLGAFTTGGPVFSKVRLFFAELPVSEESPMSMPLPLPNESIPDFRCRFRRKGRSRW